jgi:agmatine/peptidylarginine deiminase
MSLTTYLPRKGTGLVLKAMAGFLVLTVAFGVLLFAPSLQAQEMDRTDSGRIPSVPMEEIPGDTPPSPEDLQKRYDPAGDWKVYGTSGTRRYEGTVTISKGTVPGESSAGVYEVRAALRFAGESDPKNLVFRAAFDSATRRLTTQPHGRRGFSDVIGDLGTATTGEATRVVVADYRMSDDGKVLVGSWSEGPEASGLDVYSRVPEGLRTPAEFEPAEEVLLGCSDTYHAKELYRGILQGLADQEVRVTAMVSSQAVAYELLAHFYSNNVDTGNLSFYIVALRTIWMRDYGPLIAVDKAGKRYVVDIDYYPHRPADDVIPRKFAGKRGYGYLHLEVSLEGGNFMVDGRGTGYSTTALYERNREYARSQVDDLMKVYLGCKEYVVHKYILEEGTNHIDMFCKLTGPDRAILGIDVSEESAGTRDRNNALMDEWKTILKSRGYRIIRAPYGRAKRRVSYYHRRWTWSYVNSLLVNGTALVPSYGEARDAEAVEAYKKAGFKKVVSIDCSEIIELGGAIHCITQTVPK